MHKFTGPGKQELLPNSRILLYNFGIDQCHLKPEHRTFLMSSVAPALRTGGSISIVGLASRSGTFKHNDRLSLQRADSVRTFLQHSVKNAFPIREFKAFGERKAKLDGMRDGSENERYRSVLLFMSASPKPPDPVIDGTIVHEVQLPTINSSEGILDTVGQVLDVAGGVGSIINLVIDSVLLDMGTIFLTAISGIVGMAAVWLESNKFARNNGRKLGFSKAMQEMADVYSDYDLRLVPESKWKPLPHPVANFGSLPDGSVTVAERSARVGTREGYEAAWKLIVQMDRSPRDMTVTVNGKQKLLRLSGRMLLWLMYRAYEDDVWRKILARF